MEGNVLFPVFLKPDQIDILIIGGGKIALEKTRALLSQNSRARLTVVSLDFSDDFLEFLGDYGHIKLIEKPFELSDLIGKQLVIAATNDADSNQRIRQAGSQMNVLVNVADKPDLCDFYLGSIVKKGDLKLGISTNGKSPTFAKRLRQVLDETLPSDTPEVLENLHVVRERMAGDFDAKVRVLNELTKNLISSS